MQETETNSFGKVLKAERKRLGWSQQELADQVGVTQQNVGNWERGENMPKQAALDKLIEVLGPDSPIAATRLRPELRPAHHAGETITEYAAFSRRQTEFNLEKVPLVGEGRPVLFRDAHRKIQALLSPELKGNMERRVSYGRTRYMADYLSDRVCITIKQISTSARGARASGQPLDIAFRRTQRDALFQLTAIRKINDHLQLKPNTLSYVLIYLVPDEETVMWLDSCRPLLEEAALFDVHFRAVSNIEKIPYIVNFYENSTNSPDEGMPVDEIDDEEWLNN